MEAYLKKRSLYPDWISASPDPNIGLVVVIPCFAEPDLIDSLEALKACSPCSVSVEIIIVINHSEAATDSLKDQNQSTYQEANEWSAANSIPEFRFYPILAENLPKKHAGVGLARKIGMDEACRRFLRAGQSDGIIVAFDADSTCSKHLLSSILLAFRQMPKQQAISIDFQHPLSGDSYTPEIYQAIAEYELHLRYFINIQRFIEYPLAYQTIGSSMAVRASAYAAQGGMNRRKAGEDFYFLHKYIRIGKLSDWMHATVYPSPRRSDRVPFGTGKAVGDLLDHHQGFQTYAPESFLEWKHLHKAIEIWFHNQESPALPHDLNTFLIDQDLENKLMEFRKHSTHLVGFRRRFFQWMDAFQLMKFLHFKRDLGQNNVPVEEAAQTLLNWTNIPIEASDAKSLLIQFRSLDQKQAWWPNGGKVLKL